MREATARRGPVDPRLLRYARAARGFFGLLTVISVVQTAAIVAIAALLTWGITGAIDGMPWPELLRVLGLLAIAVAVRAALVWLRDWASARASATVQAQLRERVIAAVGRLGPGWLATRNTAALAVTTGRGLESLDAYFGRYLPQLVQTAIATPVILIVMWWQDWISGLTVLLTIPLIPFFMALIGLATRAVQKRQWQTLQHLAARFHDTVQGLATLKVFGRQHRAAASIERVTDDYRRETMRVLRISFLSGFALEFLASISVAIIAVSIGFRLIDGSLTLFVGLFVLLLAPEAYLPLRQVGVQFHAASEGVAATEDVFEVLDAAADRPEPVEVRAVERPVSTSLELRVEGLRVERRSDDGTVRMLPAVSFAARPGTVTVLEGPSGSGKSSVLAALRGAADWSGALALVDAAGMASDIRSLSPAQWLAWAGQQPGLIAGTIAANVALGDPSPDAARIEEALGLAQAAELAPDRELGVQGAGLSGGQAQRVAVARALYRHLSGRAPVIALDEPSAALDADTEARLWAGVRRVADAGATVLLISHRESARAIADQVVRLRVSEVVA